MPLFKYLFIFCLLFTLTACSNDDDGGEDSGKYNEAGFIAAETGWVAGDTPFLAELFNFDLNALSSMQWEVKGNTLNYKNLREDGFIDFSIVFPALDKNKLSDFNASSIISPEVDIIRAAGQTLPVPSNISIPRQREKYNFLITLTLDKPIYRSFVPFKKTYEMTATYGRFPFKKVVNEIRSGKNLFDVINLLEFKSGGSRSAVVISDINQQDITIDQWKMSEKIKYTSPQFDARDDAIVTLALAERQGLLYPTDIKNAAPGQTLQLNTTSSDPVKYILSAKIPQSTAKTVNPKDDPDLLNLKKAQGIDFSTLSLSLKKDGANNTPQFLAYVDKPVINANSLDLSPPADDLGFETTSTQVILVEIQRTKHGKYYSEKRIPLWTKTVAGWATQVDTSAMSLTLDPAKIYRWEVVFAAQQDPQDVISHISRNFTEF